MSFGFGIGDAIAIADTTLKLYKQFRKYKGGPKEFEDARKQVKDIRAYLDFLKVSLKKKETLKRVKATDVADILWQRMKSVKGDLKRLKSMLSNWIKACQDTGPSIYSAIKTKARKVTYILKNLSGLNDILEKLSLQQDEIQRAISCVTLALSFSSEQLAKEHAEKQTNLEKQNQKVLEEMMGLFESARKEEAKVSRRRSKELGKEEKCLKKLILKEGTKRIETAVNDESSMEIEQDMVKKGVKPEAAKDMVKQIRKRLQAVKDDPTLKKEKKETPRDPTKEGTRSERSNAPEKAGKDQKSKQTEKSNKSKKSDAPGKADKDQKLKQSEIPDKDEKSKQSEKLDKSKKSDAPEKAGKDQKSKQTEKPDKPKKSDAPGKADKDQTSKQSEKADKDEKSKQSEKSDKPKKSDVPEKADKDHKSKQTEKPDKPKKSDAPEKADKDQKTKQSEKSDKPKKSDAPEKTDTPKKDSAPDKPKKTQKPDKLDKPEEASKSKKSDQSASAKTHDKNEKSAKGSKPERESTPEKASKKGSTEEEKTPEKTRKAEDKSKARKDNHLENFDKADKNAKVEKSTKPPAGLAVPTTDHRRSRSTDATTRKRENSAPAAQRSKSADARKEVSDGSSRVTGEASKSKPTQESKSLPRILCVDEKNGARSIIAQAYLDLKRSQTANNTGHLPFSRVDSAGALLKSDMSKSASSRLSFKPHQAEKAISIDAIKDFRTKKYKYLTSKETDDIFERMKTQTTHGINRYSFNHYQYILCFDKKSFETVHALEQIAEENGWKQDKPDEAQIMLIETSSKDSIDATTDEALERITGAVAMGIKAFLKKELGWQPPEHGMLKGGWRTRQILIEKEKLNEGIGKKGKNMRELRKNGCEVKVIVCRDNMRLISVTATEEVLKAEGLWWTPEGQ